MSSRFTLPQGHDPTMRREEVVTLARTSSQQNTSASALSPGAKIDPRTAPQRRHFVFTDPVAFRYLEEDSATVVIERRGKLQGYELYLVEQWACSRVHPTFIITTYTGDVNHSVTVGVLGVPANEADWSPRLRVYFNAISQFHARPKDTHLGMLMVTNLSSFPSALTVIPVPEGDVRKHREDFIVNENLKRLGCSGRSGMSLVAPAGATQAKFLQLYKTSDRIPLYGAVLELVKLCQVALMIFGKLEQEYADGLLCDVTEKALNDWWTEIGSDYYNIEPTDGILGPTTVAGLLGMLMGARNRLNYYGAPVTKDAFDIYSLKRGIAYFQKSQKLDRTRRLDRHTLDRLNRATAKAAAGEGWAVPKAVKSTVVELSGKGGEMVMGMVGGRDKAGIGDIETLDIDRYVGLVYGERAKWLWYGKARRSGAGEKVEQAEGNYTFTKDEQGGYIWSHSRSDAIIPEDDVETRKKDSPNAIYANRPPGSTTSMVDIPIDRDRELRKNVFKSVTGKMNDARSGFGRIKDAVGRRGHSSKMSKDESSLIDSRMDDFLGQESSTVPATPDTPIVRPMVTKSFTWKTTPNAYENGMPKYKVSASTSTDGPSLDSDLSLGIPLIREPSQRAPNFADTQADIEAEKKWATQVKDIRRDLVMSEPSVGGSTNGDGDLEGPFLEAERDPHSFQILLNRRHSISGFSPGKVLSRNDDWWPRQMSFSEVEDAVLSWEPIGGFEDDAKADDSWPALQKQLLLAEDLKRLYEKISILQQDIGPWVERKVNGIEMLDQQATQDQEDFQTLYYQLVDQYHTVKQSSLDILENEHGHVAEVLKDIEVLGAKLEYEINALISKVQDVEDGASQFERQVDDLESRANELEVHLKTESWPHWLVRSITGIGTGPNITAPR